MKKYLYWLINEHAQAWTFGLLIGGIIGVSIALPLFWYLIDIKVMYYLFGTPY